MPATRGDRVRKRIGRNMDGAQLSAAAAWRVADLADQTWVYRLDDAASRQLADAVKAVFDPERSLFDYRRADFDFAALETLAAAVRDAHHGRGLALVKNLPRDQLSEAEFRILTWGIGLHIGVPRPPAER